MRKKNVENYIKWCEEKLNKLEQEGIELQKENDESGHLICDMTDHYLNEENFRGRISAAKYILNNC